MIRALTLMAHMMLIDMWYPKNIQTFFKEIFTLLAFDVIPTELIYPTLFGFTDIPFADQFESIGYQSQNVITNVGSIFLLLLFIPWYVIFVLTLHRL